MPYQTRFLWSVSPPVLRGVGRAFFSLEMEREAPLPSAPFVLAANHYSHFDATAIAAAMDRPIRFLALEELFGSHWLLDWLVVGYRAIPTPRERLPIKAVRTALGALDAGEIVGVFPEATRVSHWGTLPPKRGAAWLALRAGVPLVPVAVIGTGKTFDLDNRLRRAPIRVVIGEAISTGTTDPTVLTAQWGAWISSQVERFPESEVSGPPRAFHDGRSG